MQMCSNLHNAKKKSDKDFNLARNILLRNMTSVFGLKAESLLPHPLGILQNID